ncbi:hypothetical protein DLAC_08668 [Tieghemostelium lacteum]|uniref:Transmembrane protein n=1 Tax=Tieghemostelium lacteum TaxID=361077 RepID=A0A151Z8F8_TIELA|nr:hypothetical protein DLAC_08668 [Tieghemostelium lacteum]|eukprot:KYQ90084.1 hypothetical protein DLAC_08668 [Tieghemostelium lacteum]
MILPKSTITLRGSGGGVSVASRNLNTATEAYKNGDTVGSKKAHSQERKMEDEPHKSNSFRKGLAKYSKTFIAVGGYAILFSISIILGLESFYKRSHHQQQYSISGSTATTTNEYDVKLNIYIIQLSTFIICLGAIGFSLIEASNKNIEINFYESEKKREVWEYDNYVEGEQREMVELYCQKGMTEYDAKVVVGLLSKYKDLFVDIMMAEELNLLPVELILSPIETFLSTLISFLTFGIAPILPFFLSHWVLNRDTIVLIYIIISEVLLFLLGAIKSKFFTGIWWKEGLISSATGIILIIISNSIGNYISSII